MAMEAKRATTAAVNCIVVAGEELSFIELECWNGYGVRLGLAMEDNKNLSSRKRRKWMFFIDEGTRAAHREPEQSCPSSRRR
jgi:hypothetical protein